MQFNQGNGPEPIFHIEVEKIKPNPYQPRKNFDQDALNELASSIREYGILHPLVVTKIETPSANGTNVEYQLISGERRLMASKIVGLERVPAIIKAAPTEKERLELAIIENIQRENLNPLETARAYVKLQEQFGLTQREIAIRMGKSRESVANTMRLLNLPTFAQDALSKGQINESQARLLLMVSDIKEQQVVFDDLVLNNLSVRELRNRIRTKKEKPADSTASNQTGFRPKSDPEISSLEEQLMEILGTKVRVQSEGDGGKLTINFYSKEELQGIIDKLVQKRADSILRKEREAYTAPVVEHHENLIEKVPEMPEIEKPLENLNLPIEEEKLLEERVVDPNPDDLPMVIRHDEIPPYSGTAEDDFTV